MVYAAISGNKMNVYQEISQKKLQASNGLSIAYNILQMTHGFRKMTYGIVFAFQEGRRKVGVCKQIGISMEIMKLL